MNRLEGKEFEAAIDKVAMFVVNIVPRGRYEVSDAISLLMSTAHGIAVATGSTPRDAVQELQRVLKQIDLALTSGSS